MACVLCRLHNRTYCFDAKTANDVKTYLGRVSGIPSNLLVLKNVSDGRVLTGPEAAPAMPDALEASIQCRGLLGGKGGFGAMLRNAGKSGGGQVKNFGACRDLTGRRLRHVNDEMALQKWYQEQEAKSRAKKAKEDFEPGAFLQDTKSGIDGWYLDTPAWAEGVKKKKRSHLAGRYKTTLCNNWVQAREKRAPPKGAPVWWGCPRGPRCNFAHGPGELVGDAAKEYRAEKKYKKELQNENNLSRYLNPTGQTDMMAAVFQGLKHSTVAKKEQAARAEALANSFLPVEGRDGRVLRDASSNSSAAAVLSGDAEFVGDDGEVAGRGNFSTVCGATVRLNKGQWYYEAKILSDGVMQIGWGSSDFTGNSMTGDGVGDDDLSWGFDGVRQRVWHGGNDERGTKYGKGDKPWREGDVVGCYLDTASAQMRFAVNGKDLGPAFDAEKVRKGVLAGGMFPAASLESGERLQFNFGVTPFAHPPPSPFMAVSKAFGVGGVDAAVAEAEDKAALATEQSVDITSAEAAATPAPAAAQPTTTTTENSAAVQADAAPEAKEKPSPATAAAAAAAPAQDKPAFAALDLSIIKRAEDLLPLGLDHLKEELRRRGFPCGGTLQQRADRLMEIKTTGGVAKKKKRRKRKKKTK